MSVTLVDHLTYSGAHRSGFAPGPKCTKHLRDKAGGIVLNARAIGAVPCVVAVLVAYTVLQTAQADAGFKNVLNGGLANANILRAVQQRWGGFA